MVMHRGKDVDKVSTMLRPTARLQDTFAHLVPEPRGPCLEHLNMNGFFATPVRHVPCSLAEGACICTGAAHNVLDNARGGNSCSVCKVC